MRNTEIFDQVLLEKDGEVISKFAILVNTNVDELTTDIVHYWNGAKANMFVDIKLNNPWIRVIVSGINELKYENFDEFLKKRERREKLDKIDYMIYKQNKKNK